MNTSQSFDNFTTGLLSSLVEEFLKIQLLTKFCPSKNHIKFFSYPIVMAVRIKVIEPTGMFIIYKTKLKSS